MKQRMVRTSGVVAAICMGLASAMLAADEGMVTSNNLQKAYNAEVNAKARYDAFTAKADEEGYRSVAVLFRAVAYSEGIHAKNFAAIIVKLGYAPQSLPEPLIVKSTRENLEVCLKGQTSAGESMYANLISQAKADKDSDAAMYPSLSNQVKVDADSAAAMWFKVAYTAEVEHGKFFKAALGALDDWKMLGKEFAVCRTCGYTVMGQAPIKCPVCSAPQEKFKVFSRYTIADEQ